MPIPVTGALGLPMQRLAKMLSNCSTAQTILNVGTASAAYDLIKWPAWFLEDDATAQAASVQTAPVPMGIVSQLDEPGWEQEIQPNHAADGVLYFELRMDPSDTGHSAMVDQLRHFISLLGAVIEELWALSAVPDPDGGQYLELMESIKTLASPQFTLDDIASDQEGESYLAAAFAVMYRT